MKISGPLFKSQGKVQLEVLTHNFFSLKLSYYLKHVVEVVVIHNITLQIAKNNIFDVIILCNTINSNALLI